MNLGKLGKDRDRFTESYDGDVRGVEDYGRRDRLAGKMVFQLRTMPKSARWRIGSPGFYTDAALAGTF